MCIYQLCAKNTCDCANCVLGIKLVAVVEWKAINFKSTAACLAHLAEWKGKVEQSFPDGASSIQLFKTFFSIDESWKWNEKNGT